ncbi:MAG: class II glutamine amidotransferase, partial [Acidimicrobiales bacterium]
MCRLLAFVARGDTIPERLFASGELDAYRELSRVHSDGWGYASSLVSDHCIDSYRSTERAIDDPTYKQFVTSQACQAGFVHLRWATAGMMISEKNSHPFCNDEWAFAHNGSISQVERLAGLLDDRFRPLRIGTTDSEIYFLLIMQMIEGTGDVTEGIRRAIELIRVESPISSLNAVLLGADVLCVVQSHDGMANPLDNLIEACGDFT